MSEVVKFSPEVLKNKHILHVYKAESFMLRSLRRSHPQSVFGLLDKTDARGIDRANALVAYSGLLDEHRIRIAPDDNHVIPSPVRQTR